MGITEERPVEQLKEGGRESACEVTETGRACVVRQRRAGQGVGGEAGRVSRPILTLMNLGCCVGGCASAPGTDALHCKMACVLLGRCGGQLRAGRPVRNCHC